ncbi:MAG: NAD-dependent DNA ligase LigA, partial [Odoribacter sp.]|nr:NAD-dependent DNA ligase LigA [Odoribacter sp.]
IYELSVASVEEIAKIDGISKKEAELINRFFRNNDKMIRKLNTLNVYRLQEKSVNNLITSIEKSKEAGFANLLYGLGIRYVGETASRNLAKSFKIMQNLMDASYEQLKEVQDIGDQIANSLLKYFQKEENRQLVARLINMGVKAELDEQKGVSDILDGMVFVITGSLSRPREYFKDMILNAGGRVSDSVSAKTTMLLAGENAGSKLKKAEKLGTKVISEEDFQQLFVKERNDLA